MSPEQAEDARNADHRADIYSLGCTLYFLLTGQKPFPEPTALSRIVAHKEHPAPSLRAIRPDVPPALEAAYQAMMAKRPDHRLASMSEVIARLQASKPSSDDTGLIALPSEFRLMQAVTAQESLECDGSPRTIVDSAIFARRMEGEGMHSVQLLNLRDLVMDMRSDVCGTDETPADCDEGIGICDIDQLSLRHLAQELGDDFLRASAPGDPPRSAVDSTIVARRAEGEGKHGVHGLSLRDLVMDLRSDV
jgi:serine/threonine protein kinase